MREKSYERYRLVKGLYGAYKDIRRMRIPSGMQDLAVSKYILLFSIV